MSADSGSMIAQLAPLLMKLMSGDQGSSALARMGPPPALPSSIPSGDNGQVVAQNYRQSMTPPATQQLPPQMIGMNYRPQPQIGGPMAGSLLMGGGGY